MLLPYYHSEGVEAGCDEAGRGCLAGPVFAAAVILKPDFHHPLLNDSKKTTERSRRMLREVIQQEALAYAVASVSPSKIDKYNILQSSFLAMHKAIASLDVTPDRLLIDGPHFSPLLGMPHHCIVKGDSKYASIAAASILAKTYRDEYMVKLHRKDGRYGWDENKGYPTAKHRAAILHFGVSAYHRKSFKLLPDSDDLSA